VKTALGRSIAVHAAVLLGFVAVAVLVRGPSIGDWKYLNPDEAELIAQARAAIQSPVPFTTWTMGTTGPYWVLFLALLGALGLPMTLAFAHLLAAILVGVAGYFSLILLRRAFGAPLGLALAVVWWIPIALVFPVGDLTDFGGLATELLPIVLVLAAALVPASWVADRPWLLSVSGLLCGMAIGSKYQVLPLAVALVVVQLLGSTLERRARLRGALWWVLGAAVPIVTVVVAIALSPAVSFTLVQQNLGFLGAYAEGVDLADRVGNTARLLLVEKVLLPIGLVLVVLAVRSSARVALLRLGLALAGLAALFAGGMGFGHYLWLLFTALLLAMALPMRDAALIPATRIARTAVVATAAALAVALVVVGVVGGRLALTNGPMVAAALSRDSVVRQSALLDACPVGSDVLVWGWAPELYIDYSWNNTVPFMNTLGLGSSPTNHEASAPIVREAVETSDCVIDAIGKPFFGAGVTATIGAVYPEVVPTLAKRYHVVPGALSCETCTVYVAD
jgi:hypothetical protein